MLRQGYIHRLNFVIIPYSYEVSCLLKLSYKHGLIAGFQSTHSALKVFLKWSLEGESVFQTVKTYSKPSYSHEIQYQQFIKCHLKTCSISPVWLFKTKLGYTDQYSLYKNKIGGTLMAIIN